MPELPEVEALRRALDEPVSAFPVEQAGPAHVATLKTFDPPLSTLEGRRFEGVRRRGERLAEILASDQRRLHSLLRDQRAIAGIGRAWANEILHTAGLSPYAASGGLTSEQVHSLDEAIDSELRRGLELRERGAKDAKVY